MPAMPNVVGQNYDEAVSNLTAAGIFVVYPAYAFMSAPQITVLWATRNSRAWTAGSSIVNAGNSAYFAGDGLSGPPGTIAAQLPAAGSTVAAGTPISLTVFDFPFGSVIG